MRFRYGLVLAASLMVAICDAAAQKAGVPPQEQFQPDPSIRTMRVFANLIQIPTIVLDYLGHPVSEKTNPKFTVSLDGGTPFAASHARLEGEDAISLTVLMDASGAEEELVNEMVYALPALASAHEERKVRPEGLRTHDHVSIYAMDCAIVKSLSDAPAERAVLKLGVEHALKAGDLHDGKRHGACAATLPLRDTLITAALELAQLPGRRVILVVTNGADGGSKADWAQVHQTMQHAGVTVFGMGLTGFGPASASIRGVGPGASVLGLTQVDTFFEAMCQSSGGLALTAREATLREQLEQFTRLLRARYIVQFPRSDTVAAGPHLLHIDVPGKNYFIRSSGASVPIADPKLKDDPTVLRVVPGAGGPGC